MEVNKLYLNLKLIFLNKDKIIPINKVPYNNASTKESQNCSIDRNGCDRKK
jgi:hypothetical protein